MSFIKLRWLAFAPMVLAIAGCGGSDSPDKPEPPANAQPIPPLMLFENGPFPVAGLAEVAPFSAGIYRYETTEESGGFDATAIISDSGRLFLRTSEQLILARIAPSTNGSIDALITSPDDSLNRARIAGTLNQTNTNEIDVALVDPSSGETVETGTLSLQSPNTAIDPADLLSTFTSRNDQAANSNLDEVFTLTFDAAGEITGSSDKLCDIQGDYEQAPGTINVYEVQFSMTNCLGTADIGASDRNGTYLGLVDHRSISVVMVATNGTNIINTFAVDTSAPTNQQDFRSDFTLNEFDVNDSVVNSIKPGIYDYQEIATDSDTLPGDLETGTAFISQTGRITIRTEEQFTIRTKISGFDSRGILDDEIDNLADDGMVRITAEAFQNAGSPDDVLGSIEVLREGGDLLARFRLTQIVDPDEVEPVTLSDLSGIYSSTTPVGQFTTTITIATDGTLSGGDEACIFSGNVVTFDTLTSPIFEAQFTAQQCAARPNAPADSRNGTYNLVGVLTDDGGGTKTISAHFASSFVLQTFTGTN
jgi:hypothetical protein